MKIVYIAGPFRAPTTWGIEQNVRRAEALALAVAEAGAMPLCPHTNTRYFQGQLTDDFWIEGTKELLRRCDGMLLVPGWEGSTGTRGEKTEAEKLHIPVFTSINDLAWWLDRAPQPKKATEVRP